MTARPSPWKPKQKPSILITAKSIMEIWNEMTKEIAINYDLIVIASPPAIVFNVASLVPDQKWAANFRHVIGRAGGGRAIQAKQISILEFTAARQQP